MENATKIKHDRGRESVHGLRLPGKGISWKEFFTALKVEWNKDRVTDVAGMVTFHGLLALFPFVLFLVALAGLLIDPARETELINALSRLAPGPVTQIIGDRVRSLVQTKSTGLLTFSAAFAIWSASGGISAMMRALNTTYGVQESRPWWKTQMLSLVMTLATAVIALAAALAAVAAPALAKAIGGPLGSALMWGRLPVAGLLMMFLWACLYYFLPDVEQRFRFITPGSVVGVLLWVIASWGFSVYVANFGRYEVTYGALGGVVVMLVWMWISSQVLLLGAEINAVLEHRSPEGKEPGARREGEASPGKKTDPRGDMRPQVIRRPARSLPPLLSREAAKDGRTRAWAAVAALLALLPRRRRGLV
ncbi:MAG TPA: YihY/virulence factor BrkB family protein [Myxococcales bacterium]|nr:YihY/virulence factor BrkB family protein [Myxococcales bacterium]